MAGSGKVTTSRGLGSVRVGNTVIPEHLRLSFRAYGQDPDYEVTWEVRKGVPVCVSVTVTAKPRGARGIRTADLQVLNLRALLLNALAQQAAPADSLDGDELPVLLPDISNRQLWRMFGDVDEAQAKAGRGPDEEQLRRVAEIYRANIDGAPVRAVEVQLDLSPRTAARRVQQARACGLLPATTPGRKQA